MCSLLKTRFFLLLSILFSIPLVLHFKFEHKVILSWILQMHVPFESFIVNSSFIKVPNHIQDHTDSLHTELSLIRLSNIFSHQKAFSDSEAESSSSDKTEDIRIIGMDPVFSQRIDTKEKWLPNRRKLLTRIHHRSKHESRDLRDKCWSKSERHLYHKFGKVGLPSREWRKRLTSYAVMHRRCTTGINDWITFYKNPEALGGVDPRADVSGCKYLMWVSPGYAGLGNRLASLTSTFMFAVLTGRALLIGNDSMVRTFLCDPLPESSWMMDSDSFLWIRRNVMRWFPRVQDFRRFVENGTREYQKSVFINLKYACEEEDWSFFCPEEQKALTNAQFAFLLTDEYIVPGLYLVPHFREQIDRLFPDGFPFSHISRVILLPQNYIWERITKIFHGYLANHDTNIGIQVRTFTSQDLDTDARVLECAVNVSHYLPRAFTQEAWRKLLDEADVSNSSRVLVQRLVTDPEPKTLSVFMTSLHLHHYEYLRRTFTDGQSEDGSIVTLHFESSDNTEEKNSNDQYVRAFVEIWLLSFSEKLLTSEYSSFGYIAAGLAGIQPYEMNIADRKGEVSYKGNLRPVCSLGSVEPCYIMPPAYIPCGNDQIEPDRVHQFVKKCPNIYQGLSLQMEVDSDKNLLWM